MIGELLSLDYLSISKAAAELHTSRSTVTELIRRGLLREFSSELDRRARLVSREEVQALKGRAITELTTGRQAERAAA